MHDHDIPCNRFPVSISLKPRQPTRDKKKYAWGWRPVEFSNMRQIAHGLINNASGCAVWKENHRKKVNFLYSDVCQMDFENPEFTLAHARETFCDIYHCVLTTKSHQICKDGNPPIDRFRVIAPWDRRITDLDEYEYNMEFLREKYGVDHQTLDGAHLFWWCETIDSGNNDAYQYLDVQQVPKTWVTNGGRQKSEVWNIRLRASSRTLSSEVLSYLDFGAAPGGRNEAILRCARELSAVGHTPAEIRDMILHSPITSRGAPMNDSEIDSTILSAYGYIQDCLHKEVEDEHEEKGHAGS